jgi:acyl-CoA synthetase (AMP-forming)/AMP-acid ligase II
MIDGAMQPFALTLDKFLVHAAKWHPHCEVVTDREDGRVDRIGYAELYTRAMRVSAVLHSLGAQSGERIATLAWNTQAHIEVLYAILGMGAVCHTLNPRLTAAQSALMLEQSEARILIVSADLWSLASEILARLTKVSTVLIIDGPAPGAARALEPMIARARASVTWGGFDETSPSGLCFTSGTTGPPKGVTYTHRSSFLHTLRLLQADVMAISGKDNVLAVVPMFHANAWGLPFAVPAVGAKLVLSGRHADGANLERLINAEAVTMAVGIATVWLGLVEHLEATGATVPTLRRVVVGGAPLPHALMERIERRLGVTIQTSWGMTELSPSGTVVAPYDESRSAAVSGRPAVGVDLLLTDAAGNALSEQRGVEGHLRVRGASVIERYFGEEQSATDDAGWLPTGDLARIDAAGNLMITGRSKDLIKSGGEWINPAEIEAIVGAIPEVLLAAVIGRPDPKWGERPILLVEMRDHKAVSDEALLEPLKKQLASWWIPDAIVRLEQMPLTSTGKIDRMRLRSEYGGI